MGGGYESPITQIMGELQMQMENDCMKVVQQCGFDVNKEELARALVYDRDQYNKGYEDGYNIAIDDTQKHISALYKDCLNGTAGDDVLAWNKALDKVREVIKAGEV